MKNPRSYPKPRLLLTSLGAAILLVSAIAGCDGRSAQPVELKKTRMVPASDGFGLEVELKLPPGDYNQVLVTFHADGRTIGGQQVTLLMPEARDNLRVECAKGLLGFIEKDRKIEVSLVDRKFKSTFAPLARERAPSALTAGHPASWILPRAARRCMAKVLEQSLSVLPCTVQLRGPRRGFQTRNTG